MKKQVVILTATKATKNCIKYDEVEVAGQPPVLRNLYLPKWMAPPQVIRVTVEPETIENGNAPDPLAAV